MDIYTAFLFGVLVGQWALLFAIWRVMTKLIHMLDTLEPNSIPNSDIQPIRLLDGGRRTKDDCWGTW